MPCGDGDEERTRERGADETFNFGKGKRPNDEMGEGV